MKRIVEIVSHRNARLYAPISQPNSNGTVELLKTVGAGNRFSWVKLLCFRADHEESIPVQQSSQISIPKSLGIESFNRQLTGKPSS